jgi:hypothetical protein
MQDLLQQRKAIIKELNEGVTNFKSRGRELAEAERKYRVELAKEMLILRDDKKPATLISDLARGKEEIALLKFTRDYSETLYESAQQYIYLKKKELDVIEGDINALRNGR